MKSRFDLAQHKATTAIITNEQKLNLDTPEKK